MEYIKGITFAPFAHRGDYIGEEVHESLDKLIKRTNANLIVLAPNGMQDTPQSEKIDYRSDETVSDDELIDLIGYARGRGLRTVIKPTANCRNGTWRAHINFFDEDVPCEPKWHNWFASYTDFQCHYAGIADRTGCEMFIAGCEMVQTERREEEWRSLIADIRGYFNRTVSYNTDKYQEHNVKWWDAVDMISSSGYYPINDWDNQLDRIERTVKKFDRPFFFAECGCMSAAGSNLVPNDWNCRGEADTEGQADWYEALCKTAGRREWVKGFALWDWSAKLYREQDAPGNRGYGIYAKPAERIVAEFYASH